MRGFPRWISCSPLQLLYRAKHIDVPIGMYIHFGTKPYGSHSKVEAAAEQRVHVYQKTCLFGRYLYIPTWMERVERIVSRKPKGSGESVHSQAYN